MKKISAIIAGVSESVKASYKEKRIFKALEVAKINAEEELEIAESKLATYEVEDDDSADYIISDISELIERIEDAKYNLEHIKKIEDWLNTEVEG